jgi:hypothetical protein
LDSGVQDLALLEKTVHVPLLSNATLDQVDDELRAYEIDKGVTNVKLVRKVDAKVRKVVVTLRSLIQERLQVLEINAVTDVAQHDGGANIDTGLNLVEADSLRLIPTPELHVSLDRQESRSTGPTSWTQCARMTVAAATVLPR